MNYSASGPLFESDHPILKHSRQDGKKLKVSEINLSLFNGLWAGKTFFHNDMTKNLIAMT